MGQGNVVDQLYFVCDGVQVHFLKSSQFFPVPNFLCRSWHWSRWVRRFSLSSEARQLVRRDFHSLQHRLYTVRVFELCRLLRVDEQSFSSVLEIYFHDGRKILTNLLELKESNLRVKQLESDITFHIGKHEAELALRVNGAAYFGDLNQLQSLIRAGADPNKRDCDGRSALAFLERFIMQEGVDINSAGKLQK